jgi:DNA-binding XRE family transcriptional regulator
MDNRDNPTAEELFDKLGTLKKGQGVEGPAFETADLLRSIFGADRETFRNNLNKAIDRHLFDETRQECLVIAFNIDGLRSDDNLTARRQAAAALHGVSPQTIATWERQDLWTLAQGIAAELDLDPRAKEKRYALAIIDQINERLGIAESALYEVKQLFGRLKELQ